MWAAQLRENQMNNTYTAKQVIALLKAQRDFYVSEHEKWMDAYYERVREIILAGKDSEAKVKKEDSK